MIGRKEATEGRKEGRKEESAEFEVAAGMAGWMYGWVKECNGGRKEWGSTCLLLAHCAPLPWEGGMPSTSNFSLKEVIPDMMGGWVIRYI
jgi:hypothetical protein